MQSFAPPPHPKKNHFGMITDHFPSQAAENSSFISFGGLTVTQQLFSGKYIALLAAVKWCMARNCICQSALHHCRSSGYRTHSRDKHRVVSLQSVA